MLMRAKIALVCLAVFALGLVATLLSGLYGRNITLNIGVSRFGYGLPSSWYGSSQVVYPEATIYYWLDWKAFTLDLAFWSLVFALLFMAIFEVLKSRKRM